VRTRLARFAFGAYLVLAACVAHAQASLAAGQSLAGAGGYVDANWSNVSPPSATHWVGVHIPGSAHSAYKAWRYITNSASGSVNVTLPTNLALGTYELRLFAAGGGYTLLATSGTFTVGRGIKGLMTVGAAPVQNATITATNGGVCTNSYLTGDYSCGVASGWSGDLTPSHSGYVFSPTSRNYSNVVANQTSQNYSATAVYHITGTVTMAGSAAAGVTLSGTGATCTASDSSGNYDCTVPSGWSGTITPSYTGYTFDPASRNYSNVTANESSQGYTVVTYQVSGTVALNGVPLVSVAFAASNGGTCTTSNVSGQYSCTVLAGWSGTVTPSATGYAFNPTSKNYTSIAADDATEDYAASLSSPTSNISFIHADHLNTPRVVANSGGTTVWRWDQAEPFGVNVADEDPDANSVIFEFPLRYPGQYADKETKLQYNYFRDYDSVIGRYAESDLVGLLGGSNTYSYAGNSPLGRSDPSGLIYQWLANPMVWGPPLAIAGIWIAINPQARKALADLLCKPEDDKERCREVLNDCREKCLNRMPNGLPGSGTDYFGRYRRCVRECMEDNKCYDF
jgi:RHS repeat-associated protein